MSETLTVFALQTKFIPIITFLNIFLYFCRYIALMAN